MLTCYNNAYVRNDSYSVYISKGWTVFYSGMEDARNIAEILVEMGNEEYEAARILMSMKYSGDTDNRAPLENTNVNNSPPSQSGVPRHVSMMLSPWTATVLPVSTPYILWHSKYE